MRAKATRFFGEPLLRAIRFMRTLPIDIIFCKKAKLLRTSFVTLISYRWKYVYPVWWHGVTIRLQNETSNLINKLNDDKKRSITDIKQGANSREGIASKTYLLEKHKDIELTLNPFMFPRSTITKNFSVLFHNFSMVCNLNSSDGKSNSV